MSIKTIILIFGILFTSSPIYSAVTSFNKIREKETLEDVNNLENKFNNA